MEIEQRSGRPRGEFVICVPRPDLGYHEEECLIITRRPADPVPLIGDRIQIFYDDDKPVDKAGTRVGISGTVADRHFVYDDAELTDVTLTLRLDEDDPIMVRAEEQDEAARAGGGPSPNAPHTI